MSSTCQIIDPNLIQQLVDLFTLRHFQVDAFSEQGLEEMRNIYKLIIQEYYPHCYINHSDQVEQVQETIATTTNTDGFIYAPTRKSSITIDQISVTSGNEADSDKNNENKNNRNNHIVSTATTPTTPTFHMRKNIPSHLSSRRGSKDSR